MYNNKVDFVGQIPGQASLVRDKLERGNIFLIRFMSDSVHPALTINSKQQGDDE